MVRIILLALVFFDLSNFGFALADMPSQYVHKIKKNGDGSWTILVAGLPTDHPERIQGLSQLHAAQHVLAKGYKYFRLLETKKTIKCKVSRQTGTVTNGFAVIMNKFEGGKSKGNGYVDALSFVNMHEAKLRTEPSASEKQKVESRLTSECLSRQHIGDSLY